MGVPPRTFHEDWVEAKARARLGPGVRLTRRVVETRAGTRSGILVVGYRIVRCVPGKGGRPPEDEVLGVSPPPGEPLDLSRPGGAYEALEDALRRAAEGRGPYEDEVPGCDLPSADAANVPSGPAAAPAEPPASELTTSTLDLDK